MPVLQAPAGAPQPVPAIEKSVPVSERLFGWAKALFKPVMRVQPGLPNPGAPAIMAGMQQAVQEAIQKGPPVSEEEIRNVIPNLRVALDKGDEKLLAESDRKKIQQFITNLGSGDFSEREKASAELEKIAVQAMPLLRKAVKDNDLEVRRRAKDIYDPIESKRVEILQANLELLHRIQLQSKSQLKAEETIPLLRRILKEENDTGLKLEAIHIIGDMGSKVHEAVPALITALKDNDRQVRSAAAQALGDMKDKTAVLALIDALKEDKDEPVRDASAKALGKMKDKRALPALIGALKDQREHKDPIGRLKVKMAAALALGSFESEIKEVMPVLIDVLKDQRESRPVRMAATVVLGGMKAEPEKVVPVLMDALRDKVISGQIAVLALSNQNPKVVVPALIGALADKKQDVSTIIDALVNIAPKADQKAKGDILAALNTFKERGKDEARQAAAAIKAITSPAKPGNFLPIILPKDIPAPGQQPPPLGKAI